MSPIFDYHCKTCDKVFENIEVWTHHVATECKLCHSKDIEKIIQGYAPNVQMNSDAILHNIPDPVPPLEEMRGKNKPGTTGGYEDKPYQDTNLNNYTRRKDKRGNTIWTERRRLYFDQGKNKT